MGDQYPPVKVAAVQAASEFLDREASTSKACRLIRQAGDHGARLIAFPEGFIPGHPLWYHHHPATGGISDRLAIELFKNAVEIPGPEIMRLAKAARDASAYVVMGVCEKLPNTLGSMFNTQVWLTPEGKILGRHRKITPTVGERLVHTGGFGDTLGVFETDFGPASSLICAENSNPLAVFTLVSEGTRIHVMSWPNHFPLNTAPMRERICGDSQSFAQMSKAWVVSACGTMDDKTISKLELGTASEHALRSPDFCGGSVIVAPNREIAAGPLGTEEGILYAECDFDIAIGMKLRHDFAGHYNRPDIFALQVNKQSPKLYTAKGVEHSVRPEGNHHDQFDEGSHIHGAQSEYHNARCDDVSNSQRSTRSDSLGADDPQDS